MRQIEVSRPLLVERSGALYQPATIWNIDIDTSLRRLESPCKAVKLNRIVDGIEYIVLATWRGRWRDQGWGRNYPYWDQWKTFAWTSEQTRNSRCNGEWVFQDHLKAGREGPGAAYPHLNSSMLVTRRPYGWAPRHIRLTSSLAPR